jgi:hypothetical protein
MRYQFTALFVLSTAVAVWTFGLNDTPEPTVIVTVDEAIERNTMTTSTTTLPPVTITARSVYVDKPAATTTTSTTVPTDAKCPGLWPFISAWWPTDQAHTVDRIAYAESRCIPDVVNSNGADIGVMQVNWPTWSQFVTDLGYTRDDLANPAVNLLIAKLISEEAEAIGWRWCQPWDNSGRWCS